MNKITLIQDAILKTTTKQQNRLFFLFSIVVVFIPIAIYTTNILHYSDVEYETLMIWAVAFIYVILVFAGFLFLLLFLKYIRFKTSFLKSDFSILWSYDNGDVFIINRKGFLFFNNNPKKRVVHRTFKGVEWGHENLKEFAEDLVKKEVSLGTFLPSLKFETKTNRIDSYSHFDNSDSLNIMFCDLLQCKFLIVDLVKNSGKVRLNLTLPVPSGIMFGKKEWTKFVEYDMLSMNCVGQFHYVDEL